MSLAKRVAKAPGGLADDDDLLDDARLEQAIGVQRGSIGPAAKAMASSAASTMSASRLASRLIEQDRLPLHERAYPRFQGGPRSQVDAPAKDVLEL